MNGELALRRGVGNLGGSILGLLEGLGEFALLASATLRALGRRGTPWREILRQLEAIGVRSTTIVAVTALFTGMVLALQTAFALARFGAKPYVGSVVGLALVRELGPVLAATTLAVPLLTILANVLGVAGAALIAQVQYGISSHFFLQTIFTTVTLSDFLSGVAKTFAFGWIIAMVGCFSGLRTVGGTVGVGQATTRAVVTASISILIADFFLTKIFLML
jgi:phospholipid/cholesterol/gamma-HCH transport system permease protein